jgi:hypothetical protein
MFISALWYLGCHFDKNNSLMTNFALSNKIHETLVQTLLKILSTFCLMISKHHPKSGVFSSTKLATFST